MLKNNVSPSSSEEGLAWQPSATSTTLHKRAHIISTVRKFFAERNVLEVDTPLMCQHSVTDPHVTGIPAIFQSLGETSEKIMYLQTSPEYAMKRLLASGIGSIYQITKAFRQGEVGKIHNPEFTMLEWYRIGYDHHALMNEMDELLMLVLSTLPAERISYTDLFLQQLNVNVHTATLQELKNCAATKNIFLQAEINEKDVWLDILWTHYIEPKVGQERPLFLYDFPASQASLAKVRHETPAHASRFEVYFKGVELANGFHELQDAEEQKKRFEKDSAYRKQNHLPEKTIDQYFLAALNHGLPDCAGVALGIDRLIMLALGFERVADVLSFDFSRV
ncbi:MAG: elongation factor P--(R)-beta-lysine ligase [Gammaproteobacteria bacterium]|nr:elongation factor P--(R)-beta-lysine ligase [Gammaproteobacteria bacterium]